MRKSFLCLLAVLTTPAWCGFSFRYTPDARRWNLSNGTIHAGFEMTADGKFGLSELEDLESGQAGQGSEGVPSSPIKLQINGVSYDSNSSFQLVRQFLQVPNSSTERQVIV